MNSIQRRLAMFSSLVLLTFLSLTGFLLERTYRASVVAGVEQELQPVIYALMGAAQEQQGLLSFANGLSQPRLQQPESGLYAMVSNGAAQESWLSPSLTMAGDAFAQQIGAFADAATSQDKERFLFAPSLGAVALYCLSNRVDWEGLNEPTVAFVLCTEQRPYRESITQFRYELVVGFGLLLMLLSLALLLVLRWGLGPLRQIRQQLLQLKSCRRRTVLRASRQQQSNFRPNGETPALRLAVPISDCGKNFARPATAFLLV